jgi:hypothetical protein
MRLAHVVCAGLLAATIAVGAAACRDPTQITVEVTTDVKCSDLRGTTFTVGELSTLDERPLTTTTTQCDPALTRIGSMVIVPSGDNDDTVALRVVVGLGKDPADCKPPDFGPGCIVARRALRFVPHRSLTLPIFMATACDGIACGATDTCVKGDCRLATVPDPDTCTAPNGCGEAELLAPAGDAGVRDAASDAVVTKPLCAPGSGNACTSALPAGWSPLAFAAARAASCPEGFTAVDLVTRPAARLSACKCACQVSAADPPSCAKGTLVGTAGNTPTCDAAAVGGPITGTGCVVKPGTTASYARYTPLGLTRGTCASSSIVDQGATADPARGCVPSAPCGEAVCNGTSPEGFASCIVHDADVPCPAGPFVKRTLAGTSAQIACGGCPTCQNTATCSVPVVRAYNDGICTTEVTSAVVNGSCNLLTGAAGQAFGSIKYDVALTNPSCTPTSAPTEAVSLASPRTICCL